MNAPFHFIGISVRTTNQEYKAQEDLGALWGRFYDEQIPEKIPNKISEEVITIYTDYESNFMGAYTAIIGMKVSSLDQIPEGLEGRTFAAAEMNKFLAKGEMPMAVVDTWIKIWQMDAELNRAYTYDLEVYGPQSMNGAESEVAVYIAVK